MSTLSPVEPLQREDYHNGFLQLLGTLTKMDPDSVSFDDFSKQFDLMKNKLFVIRHENKIVATASLFIEPKFIRNLSFVGHIEDVVVHPDYRGKQLGKQLISHLTQLAKDANCYKVILDCSEENVPFYEKCDYVKKGVEMALYF